MAILPRGTTTNTTNMVAANYAPTATKKMATNCLFPRIEV